MTCYIHEIFFEFREQALPFNLETTTVILITLYIYSYVTNATVEITSERHQTNYDFDLIIIKRASETTARVSPMAVHFNKPDHSLKNLKCVIFRGDFKTTANNLICQQTLIHKHNAQSKGLNQDLSFLLLNSYFYHC